MTPIEKNVIVVDEQGNEYEATYPKRAKGLVKHGRARFIEESKICLTCPPDTETEDKAMSENKSAKQTPNNPNVEKPVNTDTMLTAKEIFDKIAELQKQLTESSYHSLHRLEGSICSVCDDENSEKGEQISEICNVFLSREVTLQRMLALYEKMYDDLNPRKERAELLENVITTLGEGITPVESKEALVEILKIALDNIASQDVMNNS